MQARTGPVAPPPPPPPLPAFKTDLDHNGGSVLATIPHLQLGLEFAAGPPTPKAVGCPAASSKEESQPTIEVSRSGMVGNAPARSATPPTRPGSSADALRAELRAGAGPVRLAPLAPRTPEKADLPPSPAQEAFSDLALSFAAVEIS